MAKAREAYADDSVAENFTATVTRGAVDVNEFVCPTFRVNVVGCFFGSGM
jgi:hypothetical protein